MPTVRKLDLEIESDSYPAIERTLIDSVGSGEAPPTMMEWTFDSDLFLELGPIEDASLIDRERAEEEGIAYGRRFNVSGGTGFFQNDNTPVLYMFFQNNGEHTMTKYIDLAGEAMARSLREAGVSDAVYREGGDIELEPKEPDGQYAKIGVSGAGYQNGVWGVFVNLINRTFDPETFNVIDDVLRLPEEKFADKETDSAAGRMTSLTDVAPDTDIDAIMTEGVENLAALVNGTTERDDLTDAEAEAFEDHREYYGSEEWFERYSTRRVFDDADPDHRVAEVAYKGRKLIKVSVLVDADDTIVDIEFTGDMYHRPAFEAVERLNRAVTGMSIDDDAALLAAIEAEYALADFEMPWLPPEDFLQPLVRARDSLGPAAVFERS